MSLLNFAHCKHKLSSPLTRRSKKPFDPLKTLCYSLTLWSRVLGVVSQSARSCIWVDVDKKRPPIKPGLHSTVMEAEIPPPTSPNLANLAGCRISTPPCFHLCLICQKCSPALKSLISVCGNWSSHIESISLSPVLALTSMETLLQSELFNHLYKQSILIIFWFCVWKFAYNLVISQNWYLWWFSRHSNSWRGEKTLSPQMHELPPEVEQGITPLSSHTVNQHWFLRYL